MSRLDRTKKIIENARRGSTPCVFFSGGVDSLLLLYLLKDLPVITFTADWNKSQIKKLEKLVFDWNLTLYTYHPKNRYVLPNRNGFSLVDEYGFAGFDLPVIRDIGESDRCLADLDSDRFPNFDFGFNTAFVGALKEDKHYLVGNTWFREIKQQGGIRFVSPLYDWTKEEVEDQIEEFGLRDYVIENTGEISCCCNCIKETGLVYCPAEKKEIPSIGWNGEDMLNAFREKYRG